MLPVLYVGCLAFRPQPLAAPFIKPTEYPLSHWDCDGPSIVCLDGSVACNHSAYPLCNKTKSTASCSYFGVSSTVPYEYFCGPTNDTLYNLKEVLPVTEYECIDDGGIWQVCDDLGFVNQTYCMGMSSSLCSGYDACETYGFDACLFSTAGPTTISPSQPPSSPTANPTRAPTFQLAPKDYPFAIMTEESADPTNLFPVSRDLCLGDYAVCDDGRVFCTDSSTFGDCIRPSSSLSGVTCHSSASNGQVPTSNLCGSEDGGVVTPYNISDYFAVTPFHCYNQTNDFGSLCIVNKEGSVTFGLSTVTGIFSFVENFYCSGASQCSYTYLCESNPTLFSGACDPRTGAPTNSPSVSPTLSPTAPTAVPTESPSSQPTARPTSYPTEYIPFAKPNFPLVASQCNGLYAICEGGEVFCKNLTQYPDCEAPENADPLISTSCHYTSPSGGPITDSMRLDVLDYPCVNGNSRLNVYTFLGISDYDCFNVTGNEIQMCFNNDDIVNYYCGTHPYCTSTQECDGQISTSLSGYACGTTGTSVSPTLQPTAPTSAPTQAPPTPPTHSPTSLPTSLPSLSPTEFPTKAPTKGIIQEDEEWLLDNPDGNLVLFLVGVFVFGSICFAINLIQEHLKKNRSDDVEETKSLMNSFADM